MTRTCEKGHAFTRWRWKMIQVPGQNGPNAVQAWWRMCKRCRVAFEQDAGRQPPQWWNVFGIHSLALPAPDGPATAQEPRS